MIEDLHPEYQYLDLLNECRTAGVYREGRNGGTYGLFGRQIRFDLGKGFPLLTTKRMFTAGMVDELLWFLSGSTNANDLPERSQHWWTPWMRADGNLGPIYGEQYRRSRWWYEVEPRIYDVPEVTRSDGFFCGVGDLGVTKYDRDQDHIETMLKDVWRDMIKRCYNPKSKSYAAYGAKGVHVDPDWLLFDNFSRDVKRLQGWQMKMCYPDGYTIDKDVKFASNRYSKETCIWASKQEQSLNTSTNTPFYATNPDGKRILIAGFGEAVRDYGLNASAVHRCLNGLLHTHHGWSNFNYMFKNNGKVARFRELDQLQRLVAGLKTDPYSRRHVMNLWHSPAMDDAALPCCHGSSIQFHVADGRLSCMTTQRSADILLGVPVNIASYALLTHLVAREVGLTVGDLVYNFADVHLYANHVEQAIEQVQRVPVPFPTLRINGEGQSILDGSYQWTDFELVDYNPHPAIKAQVSK